MPDQRIAGEQDRCEFERRTDNVLISTMLNEGAWPWTIQELGRELNNPAEASDAVCRLTEAGLLHRVGDLVFPTRAARRGAEIEIGTA